MKTLIFSCALALLVTGAFAQKTKTDADVKEGVMKKAGKVWLVKPMQDSETMDNGLKIAPNGDVTKASGATATLAEGDCVSPQGKLVGLNEKDVDKVLLKKGKMWKAVVVDKSIKLSDGSTILPDGTIKKADGTIVKITNDEIVEIALN